MFESPRGKWFFTFSLLVVSLLSLSTLAFADSSDPFDPASCSGPGMSVERELQILGSDTTHDLQVAVPHHRWRNVISGVAGDWYHDSTGDNLWIRFENDNGQFRLTVKRQSTDSDGYTTTSDMINCNPRPGTDECIPSDEASNWYKISVNDSCVRIAHLQPEIEPQSETIYMWNF